LKHLLKIQNTIAKREKSFKKAVFACTDCQRGCTRNRRAVVSRGGGDHPAGTMRLTPKPDAAGPMKQRAAALQHHAKALQRTLTRCEA